MAGHQGTSTRRDVNEYLAALPEAERADINTMIYGEVVSYDRTRQKAVVQPRLAMNIGGETVRAPPLVEVPYSFPRAGGTVSHVGAKKGDEVMLVVAQRSLDQSGTDASDASGGRARMHNLSDATAIPSSYSKPKELKQLPKDVKYDGAEDGKTGTSVNPKTKQVTVHADDKHDTKSPELNEQLKGLAARVAQAEHNLHGLFDVTSKFREIVQGRIPEVMAVANILNQAPGGLEAMAGAIEGKAQAYLQTAMKQGLQKFLNPNLAGLASLMGGNVEGLLQAAQAQLADLIANNPIVAQFDGITADIEALASGEVEGFFEGEIASRLSDLQGQAAAMLGANPALGQVLGLRNRIATLLDQAGAGINFLEPQKRLVQGKTKSMRFGGTG